MPTQGEALFKDIIDARKLVRRGLLASERVEGVSSQLSMGDPFFVDMREHPDVSIGRQSDTSVQNILGITQFEELVGEWNTGFGAELDRVLSGQNTLDGLIRTRLRQWNRIRSVVRAPLHEYYERKEALLEQVDQDHRDLDQLTQRGLIKSDRVEVVIFSLTDTLTSNNGTQFWAFSRPNLDEHDGHLQILSDIYRQSAEFEGNNDERSTRIGTLLNDYLLADPNRLEKVLSRLSELTEFKFRGRVKKDELRKHFEHVSSQHPLLLWASSRFLGFNHIDSLLETGVQPEQMNETEEKQTQEPLDFGKTSIWNIDNLETIRKKFADKKVIVIDSNGVLCDAQSNYINPQAEIVLQQLKQEGYELVLWTSASRSGMKPFLEENGLLNYFSIAIYRENYMRHVLGMLGNIMSYVPGMSEDFRLAIDSNTWLPDEVKRRLAEEDISQKTPSILFNSCVIIDDNQAGIFEADQEGLEGYSFIRAEEYGVNPSMIKLAPVDSPDHFTNGMVTKIKREVELLQSK